ncbi:sigma-E factor negative regulatory protein [Aromatoleum sp.]|uniref:sigma-E factor negative regulatory protein n=1 Tax=Aromatoleum sp. TaxID=2307007 RepID=UPI002FC96623
MKDKLSALLDGDLDQQSMHAVLDSMRRDRPLRADWDAYCAIGDVIRGDRDVSPDFVERVMAGIEGEPTLLAPRTSGRAPAQDNAWRKIMPLAASLMGVAAVGWVAHGLYAGPKNASPQMAAAPRIPVSESVAVSVRPSSPGQTIDPHREYLFAHQAMTGGGPISGAIQHVRTVADVRQDSAR